MATQEEIIAAYNRAKAQQAAERDLAIKEAAERLALQAKQTGELEAQAKGQAKSQATQTYVKAKQAERTLPSQLSQAGLSMSGYRSLAQQKMAREQTVGQQAIRGNLAQTQAGLARNLEADKLSEAQSRRSTLNRYAQNVANLDLEKKQDLAQQGTTTGTVTAPDTFQTIVNKGYTGAMTYDQFKAELDKYDLDATTRNAYLQNYLYYQAQRGIQ